MYCPHCGVLNPDEGRYCKSCGRPLTRANVRSPLDVKSPLPPGDPQKPTGVGGPAPVPSSNDPAPGVVVLDRYRIIAGGGTHEGASRFRAMDQFHDREVVLQFLRPAAADKASVRAFSRDSEKILREVQTAMGIPHPNLLELLGSGEWNGRPFVVHEHLKGVSLAEFLARQGRLPVNEAARFLAPAVDAVALAHRRGLVHGKLSPSTLQIVSKPAPDGKSTLLTLKVTGLGLGRLSGNDPAEDPFAAPERSDENAKPADARTDVFSLGAIYYRMITGDNPAFLQFKDEQPDLSGLANIKPVLRDVEDVVWKTLHTWDMRYGRAEELARALEQIAAGVPAGGTSFATARAAGVPAVALHAATATRPATAAKKPPIALIAGVAAGLVVAVVAVLLLSGGGSEDSGSAPPVTPRDAAEQERLERQRDLEIKRKDRVVETLAEADTLRGAGDVEAALAKVEAALALDPDNKAGKSLQAKLQIDLQQRKVREMEETRHKEYLAKAKELARNRKWKEAAEAYTAALGYKDSEEARTGKEEALAAAEADARQAEGRRQIEALLKEGEQAMRDGNGDQAKIAFQQILDRAKETPALSTPQELERVNALIAQCGADLAFNVLLNRVEALTQQNKWIEARSEIESAYAMKPQDPRMTKLKADMDLHLPADIPPGMQFNQTSEKGFKEYRILQDESVMVLIPGGWTQMGSRGEGEPDEKPSRRVYCDAFLMDKTEVTWSQFLQFCKATGHQAPSPPAGWKVMDNHPVVNVSYVDAAAYCAWAGKRLPTEAEWERAARGNDTRKWPWGNEWDAALSNAKNQIKLTTPVGQYPNGASPWGLLDMAGNAREWCADWYQDNAYASGETKNPKGPGKGTLRVQRGGSWFNFPENARCASRAKEDPGIRSPEVGFRGARTLTP